MADALSRYGPNMAARPLSRCRGDGAQTSCPSLGSSSLRCAGEFETLSGVSHDAASCLMTSRALSLTFCRII